MWIFVARLFIQIFQIKLLRTKNYEKGKNEKNIFYACLIYTAQEFLGISAAFK